MNKKRFVKLSSEVEITVSFPEKWKKNTLRNHIFNNIDDIFLRDIKILGISTEFPDLEFGKNRKLNLSFAHFL